MKRRIVWTSLGRLIYYDHDDLSPLAKEAEKFVVAFNASDNRLRNAYKEMLAALREHHDMRPLLSFTKQRIIYRIIDGLLWLAN